MGCNNGNSGNLGAPSLWELDHATRSSITVGARLSNKTKSDGKEAVGEPKSMW